MLPHRAAPWLAATLSILAASAIAQEPGPAPNGPQPTAQRVDFAGGRRLDVDFPAAIVGWSAPRLADGRRALMVLTRSPSDDRPTAPLVLWHVWIEAGSDGPSARVFLVRDDLSWNADGLDAADVDGDGIEELIVRDTTVFGFLQEYGERIGWGGPEYLWSDREAPEADGGAPPQLLRVSDPDETWIADPRPTGIVFARVVPGEEMPESTPVAVVATPVSDTAPLESLGRAEDGRPRFAGALARADRKTVSMPLYDPAAESEADRARTWRAALPASWRAVARRAIRLDGAQRILLFAEREGGRSVRVGLWPLASDPATRPLLWITLPAAGADLVAIGARQRSDDGPDDLLLAWLAREGGVEVEGRPGGQGSWRRRGTRTRLELTRPAEALGGWSDLDGDAMPDLLVVVPGALEIFQGRSDSEPIERTPSWSLPLAEAGAARGKGLALTPLSIEGDARHEIVVTASDGNSSRLQVVWLDAFAASPR